MKETFEHLISWMPVGHLRVDGEGIIRRANPATRALLGLPESEDLVGRTFPEIFYNPENARHVLDLLENGRDIVDELNVLAGVGNDSVPVSLSARRVEKEGEEPILEILLQDISERVTLEQELRQAQKLDAVGRVAGGMAHDFNNLLMIVQGRSELALKSLETGDPAIRHLYAIHRTAAQAESLTRQLLAFSRNPTLQFRVMSVNRVLSDTRDLITRWLGEDIIVRTDLDRDLWPVRGDPVQMQQVVVNLVLNARDAMPQGGMLKIRTTNVADHDYRNPRRAPEDSVLLEIRDTGRGMDQSILPYVFEPFFTTKGKGKGTGLGLSTAYGVIKQSGGAITVESELDRGTTFRIYLPRSEGTPDSSPASGEGPGTRMQPLQRPGVVLLVEDQHDLRLVIRSFLEDMGHHVIAAADAEAVLASMTDTERVDLLLTDVVLPSMSGPDLAIYIREEFPELPVLFMSGFMDHPLVDEILEAGEHFLNKPFTRAALADAVRRAMGPVPEETGPGRDEPADPGADEES